MDTNARSLRGTELVLTWEAADTILLTQGFALAICVDLGDDDLVLGVLERIGELLIYGCEVFAMAAGAHVVKPNIDRISYGGTYHQGAKLQSYEL